MEKKLETNNKEEIEIITHSDSECLVSRREFLFTGAAAVVGTVMLPGIAKAESKFVNVLKSSYPKEKIAKVSQLQEGIPIPFEYPKSGVVNFIVKLGQPAGGGVGKDQDIVAFNSVCTHMGGPLLGLYKHKHKVVGPCPLHLTTFDLTRFGIVVAGHATESLPQIMLTLEDDDIYATGCMGLIYGQHENL